MKVIQSVGETNTGRKRRRNEDAFLCEPPLFAVADGMGGAQAGEVASALATAALTGRLSGAPPLDGDENVDVVVRLIREANARVHERAISDPAASGMGTTLTVAVVGGDGAIAIGHVGDSRAYLHRDGTLQQLTDDHSLVAELVRSGELSPQQAEVHPQRSMITRALGTDPQVEVDAFAFDAQTGDIIMLCSDGLSTMVDASSVTRIIDRNRSDLSAATHALIRAANDAGGEDNITVVLFELAAEDGDLQDDELTVESATASVAPYDVEAEKGLDDEDTLHPEDGVISPYGIVGTAGAGAVTAPWVIEPSPSPSQDDAPSAYIPPWLRPAETGDSPHGSGEDTMFLTPAEAAAAAAARAEWREPEPPFPVMRGLLVGLLIVALTCTAIALGIWGLAR